MGGGANMKRSRMALTLSALMAMGVIGPGVAGSWDEKVFSSHVDFDAVAAAGESAIPDLILRGRKLFKAKFTLQDGAGRPKATPAIIPTKRKHGVNPAFTRTSGPDSNSCAGCHNDPVTGGGRDFLAHSFVADRSASPHF